MDIAAQSLAFAATVLVIGIIPGPAMLYVAAEALYGGRRAGLQSVLGVHLGGYIHVVLAASGLAALFHSVPQAFEAVKFAGAAYLVFIGLRMLVRMDPPTAETGGPPVRRQTLWRSMTVEALNPKSAIFYMALLPQFATPEGPISVSLQLLLLGATANILLSVIEAGVVMTAGLFRAEVKLARQSARLARLAGGTVIVGLGAHLACTQI